MFQHRIRTLQMRPLVKLITVSTILNVRKSIHSLNSDINASEDTYARNLKDIYNIAQDYVHLGTSS